MGVYTRMEEQYPHAADLLERETAEQGFSAGWCMHAKPVADYYFDCHIHLGLLEKPDLNEALAEQIEAAKTMGVKRALLMLRLGGETADARPEDAAMGGRDASYSLEEAEKLIATLPDDSMLVPSLWMPYRNPKAEWIEKMAQFGVRCIKLHNAPQIIDAAPADLWLSKDWADTFEAMGEARLPVLWHVTQRLTSNTYTGGGRNTYWKEGLENGVSYGNEALLQAFLTCCERHPDVNFIGAHQLHIGWERLCELFAKYPNLYADTTVGCVLRPEDTFYPHDKAFLRETIIKWADRLLFGTDTFWPNASAEEVRENTAIHQRFLTRLDLPEEVMHKVCHQNAERLFGLTAL